MNDIIVVIPSEDLDEGSMYNVSLRVTTALGGWGEARVGVFKSADGIPSLKVRNPELRLQNPKQNDFHLIEDL